MITTLHGQDFEAHRPQSGKHSGMISPRVGLDRCTPTSELLVENTDLVQMVW